MPRRARLWLVAACAMAAAAAPARAETWLEGRVVGVFDGDTIEVLLAPGETRRVRIAGIDTPERDQPWAERAKRALSERVAGKEVRINQVDVDTYGRTVGEVYADDVCVGCELVREGHAWVYRRFTDDAVLYALEAEAREAERGLWGLPEAQREPPWEWRWREAERRRERQRDEAGPAAGAAPDEDALDFVCGAKRYCRQMTGCREARFHLESCGLTRLDGDGDGTPCEALCRGP